MKQKTEKTRSKRKWIAIGMIGLVTLIIGLAGLMVLSGLNSNGGLFVYDLFDGGTYEQNAPNVAMERQEARPQSNEYSAQSNESNAQMRSATGGDPNVGQSAQSGEVANIAPIPTQTAMPTTTAAAITTNIETESDNGSIVVIEEPPATEEPRDMFFENYGVNPFIETSQDNLSTFAMDVDTGSYTLTRSYLLDYNQLPPPDAVRSEEFINYYPSSYAPPTDGTAFAIHMDAAPSPFSADGQILLRVGVQGRVVAPEDRDPALLIFVIDVSGSMSQTNRLELAKQSLEILVGELREDDRVGIVVYADSTRVVLEPTPASEQQVILSAIRSLQTEGSTYAEAGLRLGYDVALAHMIAGETTRVILVSDGVANVGATGPDAILQTIRRGVDEGITLSTIGFGMGNYNDVLMEQLANDGNGNYYYVDNLREARRIFSYSLAGTLQVIGYDAKIQVEFDPQLVTQYRLIGYENRDIADVDFRNDTVDAGEVGAGHTITALYELELVESIQSGTITTARIRYEDAETRQVVEISEAFDAAQILPHFDLAPEDFRIAASVAEFSEILRDSPFGDSSLTDILVVVEPMATNNPAAEEIAALVTAAMRFSNQ